MKLFLRPVEQKDMDLLYSWANDHTVRENAFHTEPIPYEDHKKWFNSLMDDHDQKQFIFMQDEEPVGQARITICGETAEIGYSVAPEKRGSGLGKELIRLIIEAIRTDCPSVTRLTAKVKPSNTASAQCFRKNHFCETYHQYEFPINRDDSTMTSENV